MIISIIIPVFNCERYLDKCITSVLNQSYRDIEVILVDDGSTDSSLKICKSYQLIDSRIKIVESKHCGVTCARKEGILNADGQYIIFVDSDDYIDEKTCEELICEIKDSEFDFVQANYYEGEDKLITLNDINLCNTIEMSDNETSDLIEKSIFGLLMEKNDMDLKLLPALWGKIFKRDTAIKFLIVPDKMGLGEDLLFLCYILMEGVRFKTISNAYYHYILSRENSITNTNGRDKHIMLLKLRDELIKLFSRYQELKIIPSVIDDYYFYVLSLEIRKINQPNIYVGRYYLSNLETFFNKKIIIYGAGDIGVDIYNYIVKYKMIKIVAWVDKSFEKISLDYYKIQNPNEIKTIDFDIILIAVRSKDVSEEIYRELKKMKISEEKIVCARIGVNKII